MKHPVTALEQRVRRGMRLVAQGLHAASGGRLTPNAVTIIGLLMHLPIAYLIGQGQLLWGGLLLIIFGLFDTLDGELARLQDRVSDQGGFLDASTDRFKEVLLYCGAAYYFLHVTHPDYAVWAVAACGASICVSFVKAKGEAIVAASGTKIAYPVLNRMFASGPFSFQVRMAVLILGLLTGYLGWAVVVIALAASFTAVQRLVVIGRHIS